MTGSGDMHTELVALLLADHQEVQRLLEAFDAAPASGRSEAFCEIVHTLVGHEIAEEEVVYPALRRAAADGEAIADERIAEQSEAEELLKEMERTPVESPEFTTMFQKLRTAVLHHAEAEEQTAFPALSTNVTPDQLRQLGSRYEKAKSMAPTHPHPHAPDTPPGNILLGPVAALMDRMRDALHGAKV